MHVPYLCFAWRADQHLSLLLELLQLLLPLLLLLLLFLPMTLLLLLLLQLFLLQLLQLCPEGSLCVSCCCQSCLALDQSPLCVMQLAAET